VLIEAAAHGKLRRICRLCWLYGFLDPNTRDESAQTILTSTVSSMDAPIILIDGTELARFPPLWVRLWTYTGRDHPRCRACHSSRV
jgi:hypothetical protein